MPHVRNNSSSVHWRTPKSCVLLWLLILLIPTGYSKAVDFPKSRVAPLVIDLSEDPITIPYQIVDAKDLRFTRLATSEGLSQARVGNAVQDRDGFLWFGTQYGLNRYDGYGFKIFKRDPNDRTSLACVNIQALYVDHAGTLWVGCNGFVDKFDPITETFVHFPLYTGDPGNPLASVNQITEDNQHRLWIATLNGLYCVDPKNRRTERFGHEPGNPTSLDNDVMFSIERDDEGSFWIRESGVSEQFDPRNASVKARVTIGSSRKVFYPHRDTHGTFWIAEASPTCPLATVGFADHRLHCIRLLKGARTIKSFPGIYSIHDASDGGLWLGTKGEGLLKVNPKEHTIFRYRNDLRNTTSLASDWVLFVLEDREKNVWCAHEEGIIDVFPEERSAFKAFKHEANDLKGSLVTSIFQDHRGVLWIGSTGALNRIEPNGGNTSPEAAGKYGEILSIVEDPSRQIIAGTYKGGIVKLDPSSGHFMPYGKISSSAQIVRHPITRLYFDRQGTLWACMVDGFGKVDRDSGKLTLYSSSDLGHVVYSDVKEDAAGYLWLGSTAGLQRFDTAAHTFQLYVHHANDPASLSDNQVNSVHIDHAGRVWAGTQNGLSRLDQSTGKFKNYYDINGMAGNVVSCILEDERATLWLATNQGLSNLDASSNIFRNFNVEDGLPGQDLTGWSSCFRSTEGRMFFGGFSGAVAFTPATVPFDLPSDSVAPRVVLTELRVGGLPASIGKNLALQGAITHTHSITLKYAQSNFSVQFSALSYKSPRSLRYRYRLIGLDPQWHEVSSEYRIAAFTTLPSGDYTLEIESATSHGPWIEPGTALEIRIEPAWWNSWPFRTTYICAIILSIWLLYNYRLHQISQEFALRLDERVHERTRLARELHDTLLQTVEGSRMIADAAITHPPDSAGMQTTLGNLSFWLHRAAEEGRAALKALRNEDPNSSDLVETLTMAIEQTKIPETMVVSLKCSGPLRVPRKIVRTELFWIAVEAIRNAATHSQARNLSVELGGFSNVCLRIKDDGVGIDARVLVSGKTGHFGIYGMRERAARIHAKLNIISTLGSGTEIRLTIPARLAFDDHRFPQLAAWTHRVTKLFGRAERNWEG